jgi:threonine/homoserine/homoserine lactone efflux protein
LKRVYIKGFRAAIVFDLGVILGDIVFIGLHREL